VYRSSWELKVMIWLDRTPGVIFWSSEELIIPYYDPVSKKLRRYFPDFIIKIKTTSGKIETRVLEIKPHAQTQLRAPKHNSRKFLKEVATYSINSAKWTAAEIFCKEQGWTFQIITEKDAQFT
jgi:hypothetical protein